MNPPDTDALLHEQQQQDVDAGPGVFRRVLLWLLSRTIDPPPSHARVIMMLKNVMKDIDLALESTHAQMARKKTEIRRLLKDKSMQTVARSALATLKIYAWQYETWSLMRENAERIKTQLVSQKQSLDMFKSFELANVAMENMAKTLNVDSLERVLSELQEKLDAGQEISALLGTPMDQQHDPEELDAELRAMAEEEEQNTADVPREKKILETSSGMAEEKKATTKKGVLLG